MVVDLANKTIEDLFFRKIKELTLKNTEKESEGFKNLFK